MAYLLLTVTPVYWVLVAIILKIVSQKEITKIASAKGIWQTYYNIMPIKHQFIAKVLQP